MVPCYRVFCYYIVILNFTQIFIGVKLYMNFDLLNIRLDLFDGGSAGAAAGSGGGGAGADGASGAANSGVNARRGSGDTSTTNSVSENKAGVTPTPRSRRRSGVYDNVRFGKQPTAEGAGADNVVVASDAGKDSDGIAQNTENKSAEVDKKTEAPKSRAERRKAYDEYIKGEGREFYTEDTQKIVSRRVNDLKVMQEKVGKLQPFINALADKYNLSSDDLGGLMKAIQGDRDFFTEAAAEAGMDNPETYREFREAQRKLKATQDAQKRQREAQEAARKQSFVQQKMRAWQDEARALKGKYPSFDFQTDSANPQFMSMLRSGVSIEAAYRALHHDEIVAGEVSNAKAQTEKALVDNIRAKGSRPAENGTSGASTFTYKSDVSKLNKADRAEIARRVARGERIEF